MRSIFADPKDDEQGLKTSSEVRPQRQEDGEFEGNVVYMEELVLRTMEEKKERREE